MAVENYFSNGKEILIVKYEIIAVYPLFEVWPNTWLLSRFQHW